MEAVGSALVGLSAYLQLKKAAMHKYHLWNLKKSNNFTCVSCTDQLKEKYLTQEILVFSLITP